jgi:hypothetical protein
MKTIPLKFSIALLVQLVLVAIYFFIFLNGCGNGNTAATQKMVHSKELKKQIAQTEEVYRIKIAALQKQNADLQAQIVSTKKELAVIKNNTAIRKSSIKKLIDPIGFPARELMKKKNPTNLFIDSTVFPCDSLANQVSEYLVENDIKDSLYDSLVADLERINIMKDSIIATKDSKYNDLTTVLNQSLEQQNQLVQENKRLRRQNKRQPLKNALTAMGAIILGLVGAQYITPH